MKLLKLCISTVAGALSMPVCETVCRVTTSLEKLVSERNILKETVYCFTVGATSVFSKQLQALCCFVFDAVDWAAGGHPVVGCWRLEHLSGAKVQTCIWPS